MGIKDVSAVKEKATGSNDYCGCIFLKCYKFMI